MRKLFLILSILSLAFPVSAQQKDSSSYKYWLTLAPGVINTSITLNYSFSLGNNFYKAGYFHRTSIFGGVGRDGYLFNTIDISIGKRYQSEWFTASVFTGPSYVFGKKRAAFFEHEKFYTAGLQSEIQLLFRPADEIGFGIGLYSNLNFERSIWGMNITITMGNGK